MGNQFRKHVLGLSLVISFILTPQIHADDLEDIETDMESTIAESEAAQSAAKASVKREIEEKEALKKAKNEATASMAEAKTKEADAAAQLKVLEAKIAKSRSEKLKNEKLKAAAQKKIIRAQEKVAAKKTEADAAEAANQAAKSEKEAQEKILSGLLDEQREIEKKIIGDKEEAAKLTLEIAALKKQVTEKETALVRLRANALKQVEIRDKAKLQRDKLSRKVSGVPTKVVVRSSKMDCEVMGKAEDNALTIGSIKKGTKYELYRIVQGRWVELQIGKGRGFVPKTCF